VVNFVGHPRLIGQMVDVAITETRTFTLRGEVVTQETRRTPAVAILK